MVHTLETQTDNPRSKICKICYLGIMMAIFSPLPLLVCTQYGSPSNYLSQIGKSIYYVVGDWAWLFYKVFGRFLYLSLVGKYLSHWNVCTILKAKVCIRMECKILNDDNWAGLHLPTLCSFSQAVNILASLK